MAAVRRMLQSQLQSAKGRMTLGDLTKRSCSSTVEDMGGKHSFDGSKELRDTLLFLNLFVGIKEKFGPVTLAHL